jgi:hypothetical protein
MLRMALAIRTPDDLKRKLYGLESFFNSMARRNTKSERRTSL